MMSRPRYQPIPVFAQSDQVKEMMIRAQACGHTICTPLDGRRGYLLVKQGSSTVGGDNSKEVAFAPKVRDLDQPLELAEKDAGRDDDDRIRRGSVG